MYALYNVLGLVYLLVAGPHYLWRLFANKSYRAGFGSRFGFWPDKVKHEFGTTKKWIWVHAVSVGEVLAARPLLKEIRERFPDHKILLTTVTPTGQQLAKETQDADMALYLPLDIAWWAVRNLVRMVAPERLVIVETELWPNLIRTASLNGTAVAIVNGRISDRSFRRYYRFRFFFRDLLNHISFFGMQTEDDAARIRAMGAPAERIEVTGSCKFDTVKTPSSEDVQKFNALFNPEKDRRILIAGSTHPGEEDLIVEAFEKISKTIPNLLLILAPRHIERAESVLKMLEARGHKAVLRSDLPRKEPARGVDIVVLNTIGELAKIYNLAEVVIIGKSFRGVGGQNPLEPAALGKPVVFGPFMQNFREVARLLIVNQAARQVSDESALATVLTELFEDPEQRLSLGTHARRLVEEHQGASARNAERLAKLSA